MLNQLVIVGRLVSDPQINETENGKKVCNITLAVPRSYKNSDGIYETDFIPCKVGYPMCDNVKEYCKKGDSIGIRGRMQRVCANDYTCNGYPILEIVAEKLTFLSNRPNKEEE